MENEGPGLLPPSSVLSILSAKHPVLSRLTPPAGPTCCYTRPLVPPFMKLSMDMFSQAGCKYSDCISRIKLKLLCAFVRTRFHVPRLLILMYVCMYCAYIC